MQNLNKALIRHASGGIVRPMGLKAAQEAWMAFRVQRGFAATCPPLLTSPEGNYKFAKTPVPVYGLSLAPDKSSDDFSVCDFSTRECRAGCVAFAGQGEAPNVLKGRRVKTQFLALHPQAFITLLDNEILRAYLKHEAKGETLGVRLNAFSDLEWERIAPWLFVKYSEVAFYDYTKRPFGSRQTPSNYHLTYSISEKSTEDDLLNVLTAGGNVAMVVNVKKSDPMPEKIDTPAGPFAVVDGDASDARYVDASMGGESGVVIGLRPKGRMRNPKRSPNGKGWNMIKEIV